MTQSDKEVKQDCPKYDAGWVKFVDRHPRIGWYISVLLILNYVIDLLQLVH